MPVGTLNLGILAHVDAGKTTLTERLLYCAGVIDAPGSVDAGTTTTDSLELERQRGITIKSAVASFTVGGTAVNLIDTPGHPDFVAEVERALSVLDGVVLVVSAVEGVQPQTRVLWRALERLRVPTVFFVNKIDRRGADGGRVLADIAARLTPAVVAMGAVRGAGKRDADFVPYDEDEPAFTARLAEVLAEQDDAVLTAYLGGDGEPGGGTVTAPDSAASALDGAAAPGGQAALTGAWLRDRLARQVADALVHPVFFGSAGTGAGVDELLRRLPGLLRAARGDAAGPVSGRVFKVDRAAAGDKVAYARLYSGTIAVRDRVSFAGGAPDSGSRGGGDGKVTAVSVFTDGGAARRDAARAGPGRSRCCPG